MLRSLSVRKPLNKPPAYTAPIPPLVLGGRLGSFPTRQVSKRRPLRPPSGVQGAQPPPGVQGAFPCFQKRWRVGRWDNGAGQANPPLKEGASHNKTTRPTGASCPSPVPSGRLDAPTQDRDRPPSRVQGAQPPPGVQGESPCTHKRWRVGGGTTAQAKPDPSLMEGARQDKTIRPHQRADAGVLAPATPPIAKYEQLCYSTPMKSATGPLLFLGAAAYVRTGGFSVDSPRGRGAEGTTQGARPSEEGWDRSECRFDTSSLESLRLVSVSPRLATAPSQICPGSVTPPFESRLVNVAKCRQLSHSRDICPLECYGLPLSLPPLLPSAPLPAHASSTPGRPLLFRALPEGRPPRRTRTARRLQAGARWASGAGRISGRCSGPGLGLAGLASATG